jgi:hypothetical protein
MLFKGKLNLRISESLFSVKVVLLLSLVAFSMDGVGQHLTTALEDQHLLPLHHQLAAAAAVHLVTGHSAPQARSVGMVVAAGFTPMMGC